MEIRPAVAADIAGLVEIDGTIESTDYMHIDRAGEKLSLSLRIELRPLREKLIMANRLDDELNFTFRQIAGGIDEGIALVAEHDDVLVASSIAQFRADTNTLQLLDVRVDYDLRRQGLATGMLFQVLQHARERECRAVFAEARANNFPANQLLLKCGFDLSGVDLRRHTNHDLIKESATLLWYVALD